MIKAVFILLILLLSFYSFAQSNLKPDALIWSFDTNSNKVYLGDSAIDSSILAGSAVKYFKAHSIYYRVKEKSYTVPKKMVWGALIHKMNSNPMAYYRPEDIFSNFSSWKVTNHWINTNRENISQFIGFLDGFNLPSKVTDLIIILKYLKDGETKWANNNDMFMEWTLNEDFFSAKHLLGKIENKLDSLHRLLPLCSDTTDALSFYRLYDILTRFDSYSQLTREYCNSIESADKKVFGGIYTIQLKIADLLNEIEGARFTVDLDLIRTKHDWLGAVKGELKLYPCFLSLKDIRDIRAGPAKINKKLQTKRKNRK